MQPREGRVAVYLKGSIWYGQCHECPAEHQRMRSPWLPYTHAKAMKHVAKHKAEVR